MSNQPNEKYYADAETLEALDSLMRAEDKIDKALHTEFGIGEWGAGMRGRSGQPVTWPEAFHWSTGYEKRINEKLELLESLRQGELKKRTLTIALRIKHKTMGNI